MTDRKIGTREEWLAVRLELLDAEKELTRRSDELARRRQELPWVRIDKEYSFETDEGTASLADLFRGRSQLLVYHFMFGPEYTAGCSACSAIADGFNGFAVHLANHDVMLWAVSRATREAPVIQAADGLDLSVGVVVRQRLQLRLPGGVHRGAAALGRSRVQLPLGGRAGIPRGRQRGANRRVGSLVRHRLGDVHARGARHERVRARGGRRPHTYSAYARGLDGLWGATGFLVLRPKADPRAKSQPRYEDRLSPTLTRSLRLRGGVSGIRLRQQDG